MTHTFTTAVIPAKAGIQTIIKTPTHNQRLGLAFFGSLVKWLVVPPVGQHPKLVLVRYAELLYDKLDSGLRQNDEVVGFACCR